MEVACVKTEAACITMLNTGHLSQCSKKNVHEYCQIMVKLSRRTREVNYLRLASHINTQHNKQWRPP